MKYCGNCGAQHEDIALLCSECGTRWAPTATQNAATDPGTESAVKEKVVPEAKKPPMNKGLIIGLSGAALFAIVLISALITLLIRNTSEDTADEYPVINIIQAHEEEFSVASEEEVLVAIDEEVINSLGGAYELNLTSADPISRTFMIYIVGSDLETYYGAATDDISEMVYAGTDLEWNQVVIMTGGALEWHNEIVSSEKTQIYELIDEDLMLVYEAPAMDMASPDTLTEFLTYCYANYESDAYSLILWNHGAGPIYGFGYDELSDDIMPISLLVSALDNSPFDPTNKMEIIGFDACLMSSVEVAFALSDYAEYMIASQDLVPGWGWDYDFLGKITPYTSAEGVAVHIIDTFFEFCKMVSLLYPDYHIDLSFTCLNLNNISLLEEGLNGLYRQAGDSLDAASFPAAALIRDNVKEFGVSSAYYDLVDMGHLIELMSDEFTDESRDLVDCMNQVIIYHQANIPDVNGLSLYFPYKDKQTLNELALFYTSFAFADDYTGYMHKFVTLLQEVPDVDWNMSKTTVTRESSTEYSIKLTPEQVETYASASFHVLMNYVDDISDGHYDGYYIIYSGRDVSLDEDGKLTAHYDGKTQKVLDKEDLSTSHFLMSELEVTDTYVRYSVPAFVLRGIFLDDFAMESLTIQLQTDRDGKNVKVISVTPANSDDDNPHLPNREIVDIYEYEYIQFFTFGRLPVYNDDGMLLPFSGWRRTGKMVGVEIKLDQETRDSIQFVNEEMDPDIELIMVINIKDVYGNVVSSDIIPLN